MNPRVLALLGAVLMAAVVPASAAAERPSVGEIHPTNGETGVLRDQSITAEVSLPNPGKGVDATTLGSGVTLVRDSDDAEVLLNTNTSGGGDVIVAKPRTLLASNTKYRFTVTENVTDASGERFFRKESVFTTGTKTGALATSIRFTKTVQAETDRKNEVMSSLAVGPDHRLYAATLDGYILRFPIAGNGTLGEPTKIDTIHEKYGERNIVGLAFVPTSSADAPILWVTHGASAALTETGNEAPAPDWSGKISRLSGTNLSSEALKVTGLPRSSRDHQTNSLAFRNGQLYVTQGSMSATGSYDNAWAREEHPLSAAVLRVDPTKIGSDETVDVKTADGGGSYDPYAPDAPVTIYASGIRNAFDLLWHSNGSLYVPTNGSAGGNGNLPARPGSPPAQCENRLAGQPEPGSWPGAFSKKYGVPAQTDWLFNVRPGKYYGHPNPSRCEYVSFGGNPTAGKDSWEVVNTYKSDGSVAFTGYGVGVDPEPNWEPPAADLGLHASANGVIEYSGGEWGGALDHALLIARYSAPKDVLAVTLNANGTVKQQLSGIPGLTDFDNPLDIAQDPQTGYLYVTELPDFDPQNPSAFNPRIILLRQVDSTPTPAPTPPPTPGPNPTPGPGPGETPGPVPTQNPVPTTAPVPLPTPAPTATPGPVPTPMSEPVPTPTLVPPSTLLPVLTFGTKPRREAARTVRTSCRLSTDAYDGSTCRVRLTLGRTKAGRRISLTRSTFDGRSAKARIKLGPTNWSRLLRYGATVRISLMSADGATELRVQKLFLPSTSKTKATK